MARSAAGGPPEVSGGATPGIPSSGSDSLARKRARLDEMLRDLRGVVVAFSGGVDSAYLLAAARDALGDRCVGATAVSPSLARDELASTRRLADPARDAGHQPGAPSDRGGRAHPAWARLPRGAGAPPRRGRAGRGPAP